MADNKENKKQNLKNKSAKKNFFGDLKAELKRVVWPDKEKTVRTVAAVVVLTVAFALLIWIVDTLVYGGLNLIGFHGDKSVKPNRVPAAADTVPTPSAANVMPTQTLPEQPAETTGASK